MPYQQSLEYTDYIPCSREKTLPKRSVLGMTLNYIQLWSSSMKYLFFGRAGSLKVL